MRGGISGALALLLLLPLLSTTPLTADADAVVLEEITVETVDGTTVDGYLAYRVGVTPTILVVFAHGVGNTVAGAWLGHMEEAATYGPVAVVAVDFRDNNGFPILRGAEDTNKATLFALKRFPTIEKVILMGVSMGGAVSGTAIAERPVRADGVTPLYDYWIDVEGVSNLFETYYEAKAVGHYAAAGSERDAGGSPEQVPLEYARRSPALRAGDLAALKGVYLVHAVNDGTVPYDQSVEMAAALQAVGIPHHFTTVVRELADRDEHTTGTGRIAGVAGAPDPSEASGLHMAGHSWEGDRHTTVMSYAFLQLQALVAGEAICPGESVVDNGVLVDPLGCWS